MQGALTIMYRLQGVRATNYDVAFQYRNMRPT